MCVSIFHSILSGSLHKVMRKNNKKPTKTLIFSPRFICKCNFDRVFGEVYKFIQGWETHSHTHYKLSLSIPPHHNFITIFCKFLLLLLLMLPVYIFNPSKTFSLSSRTHTHIHTYIYIDISIFGVLCNIYLHFKLAKLECFTFEFHLEKYLQRKLCCCCFL